MSDFHVTRLVLNRRNLGKILKGQEGSLKSDLNHRGTAVANRANGGSGKVSLAKVSLRKASDGTYVAEGRVGRVRYRSTVRSTTPVVVANSPLLRSLDAAKGTP